MIATVINVVLILLGSCLGLVFKNRISARFASSITFALGLCVLGIGISSMIGTADTLCVIVCMVIGTLLGELIDIEKRMDSVGTLLRNKILCRKFKKIWLVIFRFFFLRKRIFTLSAIQRIWKVYTFTLRANF